MTAEARCRSNVLVVEDDEALQLLMRTLLDRAGCHVECAANGAEALRKLAGADYAAIVLDLMMPGVNGFDVLAQLTRLGGKAAGRVIVASGVNERLLDTIDRGQIFAVVRKPFDIAQFVSTVKECTAAH